MSDKKSEFLKDYPINTHQDVRWGDMDAFGHVNNTVYFRYFEDIRIDFFDRTQVNQHMKATKIGPILATTQCQFRAPLTHPDHITVGTRITELDNLKTGEKRFIMEYAVFSDQQNCVAAKGEGAIVYYDYNQNKSCAIPEVIIENFKAISKS